MHIPRQSDGPPARTPVRAEGADELRARRRHLVGQLRSVGYWQRLVQARTDLSVAGLLYSAPAPAPVPAPVRAEVPSAEDAGPDGLQTPPEGVDIGRLLGGACADGPGADLDRLREVTLVLVRRSRALQEELDVVTTALHDRLARDGAEVGTPDVGTPDGVRAERVDGRAALA